MVGSQRSLENLNGWGEKCECLQSAVWVDFEQISKRIIKLWLTVVSCSTVHFRYFCFVLCHFLNFGLILEIWCILFLVGMFVVLFLHKKIYILFVSLLRENCCCWVSVFKFLFIVWLRFENFVFIHILWLGLSMISCFHTLVWFWRCFSAGLS